MSSTTVIDCLVDLFSLFRVPSYVRTDRGASFISKKIQDFLHTRVVATSTSTPYNPLGNGQIERENGTIWRTVTLALKPRNLLPSGWEVMLPDALHSRICITTNETPHERMFKHNRRSANGCSLPSWLVPSTEVLRQKHVRSSKYDPLVEKLELIDVNLQYARVRLEDGRETTVSLRHLALNSEGGTRSEFGSISNDEANLNQEQSKGIPEGKESGNQSAESIPKLSVGKDHLYQKESTSFDPSAESPSTSRNSNRNRSTRKRRLPEGFK